MLRTKKRLEELEERVRKIEAKNSKDLWESQMVETFEYGRVSVRTMIRKLAAHLYKEEAASRGNVSG